MVLRCLLCYYYYERFFFLMLVYLTLANDQVLQSKLLVRIFFANILKCSKTGKDICLSYILIELWTQYKICFQIKAILYPTNQYPLDFSKTRHFNEYLRIQTGEKPYKWNQCPMDFSQNGSLKGKNHTSAKNAVKLFHKMEVWRFIEGETIPMQSLSQSFLRLWKFEETCDDSLRAETLFLQSMPKSF